MSKAPTPAGGTTQVSDYKTRQAMPRESATGGLAAFGDRLPDVKLPATPPMHVRRLMGWLVILGFGIFGSLLFWAATMPMTSAVVATGAFRVAGDRLSVQHLEGGIVRDIRVVEGSTIDEGEVIAVLDGTSVEASLTILEGQLVSALAQQTRLRAELSGADEMPADPDLAALIGDDPRLRELYAAQEQIFEANTENLAGQEMILSERIEQVREQIKGYEARIASVREQLELVSAERADLEKLFDQGLVTRPRISRLMQSESGLIGDLGSLESDRENARQRMIEAEERVLQVQRGYLTEVSDQLQTVQAEVFDLEQRIEATREVRARQTIRAPKSGRVVALEINTLGQVIRPGQLLLEIVPTDADFVIETQVRPADIDEVILGGKAMVRLTAYSFRSTLPVEGEVTHVSADSLIDETTGLPYYRVDVLVPPDELAALPQVKPQAGMPAQVMIETGQQTVLDYMLDPVLGSFATAMRETGG